MAEGEQRRVPHYLRPNESSSVPRRHVFVDTEAHVDQVDGGHEQRWAVAVACFRAQRPDRPPQERWELYDDPLLLWRAVDVWAGKSGRTVLWAHNLGYDVRIAEALATLPELGWELQRHSLAERGTWLRWRKEGATLVMVDSASVYPVDLAQMGVWFGLGKLPLPEGRGDGVGLYSRCWRDVEILRVAVLAYLAWLEREDLGTWALTGAAQSWATYRHRWMSHHLLVHDDVEALAAERRAMWAGRCEAYWRGQLSFEVVHEWDFALAYPRVAAVADVPTRLLGPMPQGWDWRGHLDSTAVRLLAEVEVTTAVPVVPARHGDRILWPVGHFTTTLWDVEISAALQSGAQVQVRSGWLYRAQPALREWARWVLDTVETKADVTPAWQQAVVKHWGRALIGRFAMTYTHWADFAVAPQPAVRAYPMWDAQTGRTSQVVQVGRRLWVDAGAHEWGQSMPAVTGYIQAQCRVWLWDLMRALPPRSVLYADTDSVLVPDGVSDAVADLAAARGEWGLRLKRSWEGFAIWGPRQIRTGEVLRVSGLPKRAEQVGRQDFVGEVWQGMGSALLHGCADRVLTRGRTWHVEGVDHRRTGTGFGWTAPVRLPYADGAPGDAAGMGDGSWTAPQLAVRPPVRP